jgi:hypothetical protein
LYELTIRRAVRAGGVWKTAGMSRIVMVHGAGNDLWGPASIKAKWFPALADGLAWHGVSVDHSDVSVAFYGDVFRRDPEEGYEPPVDEASTLATVRRWWLTSIRAWISTS